MIAMMIWSLSVAGGVGPIFYQSQKTEATSYWSISWLMLASINQSIGSKVAGIVNESDFSRYSNTNMGFVMGTVSVQVIVGTLVSLGGLVTTAACQVIYGEIWWNPPDLMMVMMESE